MLNVVCVARCHFSLPFTYYIRLCTPMSNYTRKERETGRERDRSMYRASNNTRQLSTTLSYNKNNK